MFHVILRFPKATSEIDQTTVKTVFNRNRVTQLDKVNTHNVADVDIIALHSSGMC